MDFSVEITTIATEDIEDAVAYIAQDSVRAAEKWKSGLETLIVSLAAIPNRFPIIPEADELTAPYRSAIYHSHRVIYQINEERHIVYVVRIYHGARRRLSRIDFDE